MVHVQTLVGAYEFAAVAGDEVASEADGIGVLGVDGADEFFNELRL